MSAKIKEKAQYFFFPTLINYHGSTRQVYEIKYKN